MTAQPLNYKRLAERIRPGDIVWTWCSIDECSARETMSAGMATLAAAASKP
jgi:hypothetical protein